MSSIEPDRVIRDEADVIASMGGIPVDDLAHALHVAHLANELFQLTWPLHGLGPHEAALVRRAALLHDAGLLVSYRGHHKQSLRLIMEGSLPDLTAAEQAEVACIARYHRKALPYKRHPVYRDLDRVARRRVEELGGILRLADAFDYEHDGGVVQLQGHVLSAADQPVHVLIRAMHRITDHEALQRVMRQAHEKRDLFERTFQCRVSISPEPYIATHHNGHHHAATVGASSPPAPR